MKDTHNRTREQQLDQFDDSTVPDQPSQPASAFHMATSTAFPQPAPGKAPSAGPVVVPAGKSQSVLGITDVKYIARHSHLAIVDSSLADKA
jgi:hypothetical protein